jgi:hypothetical protein
VGTGVSTPLGEQSDPTWGEITAPFLCSCLGPEAEAQESLGEAGGASGHTFSLITLQPQLLARCENFMPMVAKVTGVATGEGCGALCCPQLLLWPGPPPCQG